MYRALGATLGATVMAVLGLLTWEFIALLVSFTALGLASWALWRSGERDNEVRQWREHQMARAVNLGKALNSDLRED